MVYNDVAKEYYEKGSEAISIPTGTTVPRLKTITATLAEASVFAGNRYYVQYEEDVAGGGVVYIKFQMPSLASGYVVALQQRHFATKDGGASMEILWNTTGGTLDTPLTSYNENRNSDKVGNMTAAVFTEAPTGGDLRESDFIPSSGSGSNTSGDVSSELGFRIYSPDSDFVFKLTNDENSTNRIHVSYSWIEIPVEQLDL